MVLKYVKVTVEQDSEFKKERKHFRVGFLFSFILLFLGGFCFVLFCLKLNCKSKSMTGLFAQVDQLCCSSAPEILDLHR